MRTTKSGSRSVAARLASVVIAAGFACLAVMSDPSTGTAYAAGAATDPTGYFNYLENDFANGPNVVTTTGATGVEDAAGDAVLTGVCTAATGGFCLAAGIAGAWALSHWGPSVWHWAFGSSHASATACMGGCNSVEPGYGFDDPVYSLTGCDGVGNDCTGGGPGYYVDGVTAPGLPSHLNVHWSDGANTELYVAGSPEDLPTLHHSTFGTTAGNGTIEAVCLLDPSRQLAASWGPSAAAICGGVGLAQPGSGSLTVTGSCYNASTFAADGVVSGTSSWSSSDTTIPDTTLPACGDDDMMGGIQITGTGSSAGVGTGIGPGEEGLSGSPTGGTLSGSPTGGGHPIPEPCLNTGSKCSTVWEHAEGALWVEVSPSAVPADHGFDYRCEIITSAGVDVTVAPDQDCPAPGTSPSPEPTTTATPAPPGTLGPPKDNTDPTGNGLDLESCFPGGWGLMNPLEWVVKPGVCLFAPNAAQMQSYATELKAKLSDTSIGTVTAVFGDFTGAVVGLASSAESGSCDGPQLPSVPTVGLTGPTYPLSACADPMKHWASITHGILTFLVSLGGGWVALDVVAGAFGFHLPWKRISPWWDGSEQLGLF